MKTWSLGYWETMGRCIAVGQLPTLLRKADCIVWCTTDYGGVGEAVVEICGWNLVDEIHNAPIMWTGPDAGRKVENHQFSLADLRKLEDLNSWIS